MEISLENLYVSVWVYRIAVQVLIGGRKKRMTKRMLWLLSAYFVVILTLHYRALVFYKQIGLKEGEVWQKMFSNIICRLLSSAKQ